MSQKNKIPQNKPAYADKLSPEKKVVVPVTAPVKKKRFMSVTERLQRPLHPQALSN